MGHVGADFGGLLKAMREARRISQSKLAERADFDHSYVSRLESGARMPTRDAVERLASALTLSQSEEDGLLAAAGISTPRRFESALRRASARRGSRSSSERFGAGGVPGQHPPGAPPADRAGTVRRPTACSERTQWGCGLTACRCCRGAAGVSAPAVRFVAAIRSGLTCRFPRDRQGQVGLPPA